MTTVIFNDLLDAFEFANFDGSFDHGACVDLETGRIYWISTEFDMEEEELPEDIDTSDRYLMLPDKRDLDLGSNLALSFAHANLPDEYRNVVDVFHRKGAYGRFKDLLDRHDALAKWYDFEAQETEAALRDWCRQHAIRLADPDPSESPEPKQ